LTFVFLLAITENRLQFTSDMKKLFVLSMFISFAMICSCQKQGSATEAQLAQRKTALDAREKALDEREKELALRETVLNERQRALAQKEKAMGSAGTINPNVPSRGQVPDAAQLKSSLGQVSDPADLKAQREKMLKQLPPEVQALIPDASQMQAARERRTQQLLDQRQRMQELQRRQPQMQNQSAIPASTPAPAAVYPSTEAASPSPSPTPQ
jgi:hypothetical protein